MDPADCIISVLGAPASGKGTLCKKLIQDPRFNGRLHHVSVGDLLRGMPSGPDINGHIAAGTVLPGNELVPILRAHLDSLPRSSSEKKIVLLDGFPRSLEQEAAARNVMVSAGSEEFPDLVVYFSCPKEVLRDRYVARKRGKDDGRLFEKRYEQHEKECPRVVEKYKSKGVLVEVDSSGSIDESFKALVGVLETFLEA
ncbi:P-loop containing nucleoside triphosphate hydrolase protein [Apiosordaria backusii]|uniref:P-loop containing nucleoside triphosphate hydrolase protein n=1 Tax=Apiosordaria backusii TaxID=314023 RepID=A0AA40BLW0_9PEZI|nr:P-loop containing nucleoside triphosphate hydrolase protein [Apiosordaria backusii]